MPIDERMVKWDERPQYRIEVSGVADDPVPEKPSKGGIDPKMVKWDAPKAQAYDVHPSLASLMNIGQALTFGFGDEIAGKFGLDRDRYRATVDQFGKDYPVSAGIGSVSGGMLLPGGGAKLLAMGPVKAAALVGGMTGLAQGAGDAKELKDIPKDAAIQGAAGAVFGPAVLGMAKPVGSVVSALGAKMSDKWAENVARRRIVTALERDGVDVDTVRKNMSGLGPEARIADAAGENTRGLLDLNANLPGKTKEQLEGVIRNRIATRPERMDPAVYAVNGGYGRAGQVNKALQEQKREMSAPLYAEAHALSVDPTEALAAELQAAKKLGAFGLGKKLAEADRVPFTLGNLEPARQVQVGVDAMTNTPIMQTVGGGKLSVRDIDYAKRGLDAMIDKETDKLTGKVSTLGASYVGLKNRLLAEVDALTTNAETGVSAYKAARDAFAGPAALQTAITKGRSFLAKDAESVQTMMEGMTNSEQEAFRIGASEALRSRFGNQSGQTQFLSAWKDRNVREKLQALLGDEAKYEDVLKLLRNEETLKRLESLGPGRNSRTFSREAGADDQALGVAGDLAALGVSAKTGSLPGIIGGVRNLGSRVATPEPVRDSIGSILLQQYYTPELKALMEAQELMRKNQKGASAGAGVAGGKSAGFLKGLLE